jgi:hypothetical protein
MLSLEDIERRLENPKAYYIFYQFFYKAAVGEVRWKECMDCSEVRIGNDTTEAFALLLFANNYKAWLYEEKLKHGQALWTDYDRDGEGRDSIMDAVLVDQEFVFNEDTEEMLVICDPTKQTYKTAVKARTDWLADFKSRPVCAEMTRSWCHAETNDEAALGNENERNAAGQSENKKERDKKRRKLIKGLKKWTGTADQGERKFKGWSDNGHKAFVVYTMNIKDDVANGKYAIWEKAFRVVHAKQQEARMIVEQPAGQKYTVNRSVVWEL